MDTTVDGGGHQMRTNMMWLCGMCRRLPFVLILPRILHGPKAHLYLGMERTTVNSLVPFRSVPTDGIGLRHALRRENRKETGRKRKGKK